MIRQATASDIPYIIALTTEAMEEMDKPVVDSMIMAKVVNSFHLAPCFLLEKHGNIVGIAGFTVITSSWSGDATLTDYLFYVQPEHRNMNNLSGLVKNAKEFASEHDLPLRIESMTHDDEDARKRLFDMHNFKVSAVVGMYNA